MSKGGRVVPAERLTAYERWELPLLDAEAFDEPESVEAPEPPDLPTAAEIEAIERQAYEEGFARGLREGTDQGLEEGRQRGHAEGVEAGHQEGHEAGFAEGLAAGKKELDARLHRLDQILGAFTEPFRELDAVVEEELSELAITIARQLVRRELHADPGQVVAVAREAMNALPSAVRQVTIHLHPDDAKLVRDAFGEASSSEERHWSIREEPGLTRGGCRLSSEISSVDATVERRLTAIVANLLGGEREGDGQSA